MEKMPPQTGTGLRGHSSSLYAPLEVATAFQGSGRVSPSGMAARASASAWALRNSSCDAANMARRRVSPSSMGISFHASGYSPSARVTSSATTRRDMGMSGEDWVSRCPSSGTMTLIVNSVSFIFLSFFNAGHPAFTTVKPLAASEARMLDDRRV